ncbi:hypothetical protein BTIS_1489 [Bifidobacterium tissieri]|uniref:DNA-binding protein n=1 Tax=Bifidobacterium tissieri TaxID=1630162 RepID=A0A261FED7_9BIFI|nr:hypothetical protein [Bifidobacterium tissieri]OZG57395.1 hypothetical protein BTIS_1489 [Bifidobacterium tissieri]
MYGRDQTNGNAPNGLMDIDGFCAYVPGMTRGRAAQLRYTGKGPRFIKPSARMVVYRKEDVDQWLADSVRASTVSA